MRRAHSAAAISVSGSDQRFFGLGLLKIAGTHRLTESVYRIWQEARSSKDRSVGEQDTGRAKPFEFKFSRVKRGNLHHYKRLIDALFAEPEWHFAVLILDKENPGVRWKEHFDTVWDAYIVYSRMMLIHNVDDGEEVAVLADYLGKPKDSARYFEQEVRDLTNAEWATGRVFSICMLESESAPLIQVVDVLLGCVRYAFEVNRQPGKERMSAKAELALYLRAKLGQTSLGCGFTRNGPQYFNVWEFKAQTK